jgi:selenocysteine lyase/cysteine desulfurase
LFNVDTNTYDITITNGSTYSANIVINWLSKQNKDIKLIVDNSAHNSIYRTHYEKIGTKPILVDYTQKQNLNIDNNSYYCVITHVNNVDGTLLSDDNILYILEQLKPYDIPVIIDVTQSAGTYDINIHKYNYDNLYIVCSGHKGLYSTTGIGFLISPKNKINIPLISGGTGGINGIDYKNTNSLEAGTPNELAMVSLINGIDYVTKKGYDYITSYKQHLVEIFLHQLNTIPKNNPLKQFFELVPCQNLTSGIITFKILDKQRCDEFIHNITEHGFMVRTGVHCAPLYHINILKCESTLRFSFGIHNTTTEIKDFYQFIETITC